MNQEQDLAKLRLAAQALKDLGNGWPPREIAHSDGSGLDGLIAELDAYIAAREVAAQKPQTEDAEKLDRDARIAALKDLQSKGLTFSDAVNVFGEDRDSNAYARKAADLHGRDGELEFDDTVVVSESDDGAYVMCWQWVDKDDAGIEDDGDDD